MKNFKLVYRKYLSEEACRLFKGYMIKLKCYNINSIDNLNDILAGLDLPIITARSIVDIEIDKNKDFVVVGINRRESSFIKHYDTVFTPVSDALLICSGNQVLYITSNQKLGIGVNMFKTCSDTTYQHQYTEYTLKISKDCVLSETTVKRKKRYI